MELCSIRQIGLPTLGPYHICPIKEAFSNYVPSSNNIWGIGNIKIQIAGRGTIKLKFNLNGKTFIHTLNDVIHAPNAINSVLSIPRFDAGGRSVTFAKDACMLKLKKGDTIGTGIQRIDYTF